MVIDPNNIANTGGAGVKSRSVPVESSAKSSKSSEKPATTSNADSVSLSAEAQSLGKLEASIAASPDVDTAKVESVRNAIASGEYKVDADAIAEKALSQDLLL